MLHELPIHEYTELAKVGRTIDLEPQMETLVALARTYQDSRGNKALSRSGRAATATVVIYISAPGGVTIYMVHRPRH